MNYNDFYKNNLTKRADGPKKFSRLMGRQLAKATSCLTDDLKLYNVVAAVVVARPAFTCQAQHRFTQIKQNAYPGAQGLSWNVS